MPTVKLHANLRAACGKKEIKTGGTNLHQCIIELIQVCPELDGVILELDKLRSQFIITINGRHALDLSTAVDENDVISIFPPISGG
jgi:molybdopterin converting factor small subunit